METNTIKLAVIQGKTITETAELHGGKSGVVRVRAPKDGKFVLVDAQTAHAPENITIKRVGKNLHLALEGDELNAPSLIVEDFYGSEGQLLGLGEDGSYYEYVAADGEADHEAAMLLDGSDAAQVLGTDKLDVAAATAESTNNNFVPLLLGASALLAALLIRGGGQSDDPAPPQPTIDEVHVQTAASPARIASGDLTNDNAPAAMGNGSRAGNLIEVSVDGTVVGQTVVDADGIWRFTFDPPLVDGAHSVTVREQGSNGKWSEPSAAFDLVVDTIPPDAPIIETVTDNADPVTGDVPSNGYTNDVRPVLSGTAEKNSVVTIYDGTEALGTAIADENGRWTFTVPADLADRTHQFTATAADAAGNLSTPSDAYAVIVDTVVDSPVITGWLDDAAGGLVGNIASGGLSNDNRPAISGTGEAGAVVTILDNGAAIGTAMVRADGTWSFEVLTPLGEGNHALTATQVDKAGNASSTSADYEMTVDTQVDAPVITGWLDDVTGGLVGNIASGGLSNDNRPAIGGTGEVGAVVTILDNGAAIGTAVVQADGTWSFEVLTPLGEGNHALTATQVDTAGNASTASAGYEMTVDTTPPTSPTLELIGKDSGESNHDFLTRDGSAGRLLSGNALAATEAGTRIEVSIDGGTTWQQANVVGNRWYFMDNTTHTSNWEVQVRAVDLAGNISAPAQQQMTLDTTAPNAPASITRDGDTGYIIGIAGSGAVAGDRISIMVGQYRFEHVLTQAEIDAGQASAKIPTSLYDAIYIIPAEAYGAALVDKAGNTSPYIVMQPSGTDFQHETPRLLNNETADFGLFSVTYPLNNSTRPDLQGVLQGSAGGNAAGMPLPAGTVGLGFVSTTNYLTFALNDGRVATSLTLDIGDPEGFPEIIFYDQAGNEVHRETLPYISNDWRTLHFDMPEGKSFASFSIGGSRGEDFIWIDNVFFGGGDFSDAPSFRELETQHVDPLSEGAYYGGSENDVFELEDVSYFAHAGSGLHGNGGIDTLKLTGAGQTLDLSALQGKLSSIETIDITGSGNNTLKLSLEDVLEQGNTNLFINDGRAQMMVKGNAGDVVQLSDLLPDGGDVGDWAQQSGTVTVDAVQYNVYYHSGLNAELLVQTDVHTTLDNH